MRDIAAELAAHPDDVELQAVYADWLIEQGGEHALRGELILLSRGGEHAPTVRARTRELALLLEQHWNARRIGRVERTDGFIRSWRCPPRDFAAHARVVLGDEPLLRAVRLEVEIDRVGEQLGALAATPELARLRHVELIGGTRSPDAADLAVLFASPYWPRLDVLRLPRCRLGTPGAELIANTEAFGDLRELDLQDTNLGPAAVELLAASPNLHSLERLVLYGNKIGVEGVRALAATVHLKKLARINARSTWLSHDQLAPIDQRFPGALDD